MVSFRITKNGFIGNGSGSLTGSLLGTASHAITASSVAWNDVTGKPSTYPAAAHDHAEDHLKPTSVTTTGDITVGGNLIVNGSQTVIKTKNLTVKDKLIEIASGSISREAADGAGIAIQTASAATQEGGEAASARIQYRSSDNHFTASIGFVAPSFTGSLQGTATHAKLAESAEKLSTSNVGGTGEPVYFENGVPVADAKTKGAVDWVTNYSGSLSTPDEVIWKKGTGTDSAVQVLTGDFEAYMSTASEYGAIATGFGTGASGMISHAEGSSTTASGMSSHAEGYNTVASGLASHAEGHSTTASGEASHAEGYNTTASGDYSHAEGDSAKASGMYSHAEGYDTIASNNFEHAQGILNDSSENQIFSVGAGEFEGGVSTRRNAISILSVPNADTKINTASFFVQNIGGYDGTNPTPGTNDLATVINGVSSIWKKGEGTDSAVRVLTGDLKTLTPLATGIGTVAVGLATVASGTGSHAEGMMVAASGICSHAEGQTTEASGFASHAEGFYTTASGDYSHAEGSGSIASGQYSHAEGLRTTASGVYSHVEGYGTDAGDYSHAEGTSTKASGTSNHAEGLSTEALGYASHAEGCSTTASGDYSHAEGFGTTTSNVHEHAQGMYNHTFSNQIFSIGAGESDASRRNAVSVLAVKSNNNKYTASVFVQNIGGYNGTNPTPGTNDLATVIGKVSSIWKKSEGIDSIVQVLTGIYEANTPTATRLGAVAIGYATTASGTYSHAEGRRTIASGDYSHAEGYKASATGDYSHAEGDSTNASGQASYAEGIYTVASGGASHAEGEATKASGDGSHAEGYGTIASNSYEHAQGTFNHSSENQIFSIGAGEIMGETVNRRNAISVLAVNNNSKYTSSFFVQNIGGYDGTNPLPGTNDLATVINKIKPNAGTVTSVGVSAGAGITASVTNATTTPTISISSAQAHTHDNKAVLDGITAAKTSSWTSKQEAIADLDTIRSSATNGQTAYDWGNHASAGYATSEDITTAINNLVAASESKWSTDTDTKVTSADNHYKPKQSTAKTASAGSVISGIYLDAAGHVTGVSSSGQINKATIATKLVETSGSIDVPVYIDAGVPKECKANLVSLPIFSGRPSEGQAQSGTITLAPGVVHKCGTLTENLTINLDTSSIGSHEAIYCCVFNMGSTLQTITLPEGVKVVENSADLDTTGVYYEINIMNNVAIIARTAS